MRMSQTVMRTVTIIVATVATGCLGACSTQGRTEVQDDSVTGVGTAYDGAKTDGDVTTSNQTGVTGTGTATGKQPKADDGSDATGDENGTTDDLTDGSTADGSNATDAKEGNQMKVNKKATDDGLSAYAAKVGYKSEAETGSYLISDKATWDEFADTMADVIYDGNGKEIRVPCASLKEYDRQFFKDGNRLLVAYMDLGSGGYNPTITELKAEDDGVILVRCDLGAPRNAIMTTDMSGFLVVIEAPPASDAEKLMVVTK